jgi:hypothetical protein
MTQFQVYLSHLCILLCIELDRKLESRHDELIDMMSQSVGK